MLLHGAEALKEEAERRRAGGKHKGAHTKGLTPWALGWQPQRLLARSSAPTVVCKGKLHSFTQTETKGPCLARGRIISRELGD